MNVSGLFEAAPIRRNTRLGFNTRIKIPLGGTKEWMKAFGADETHMAAALEKVRETEAYKAVVASGMREMRHTRNSAHGSMAFNAVIPSTRRPGYGIPVKFTVQPNGKVDETSTNQYHRYPLASGKPRIVPNDPVMSIVKSMGQALKNVARTMERRKAQAAQK